MRQDIRGSAKFYRRGLKLYPEDELFREMSFISYYFHWSEDEVLSMEHVTRRRWCEEISNINKSLSPDRPKHSEKSITEMYQTKDAYKHL